MRLGWFSCPSPHPVLGPTTFAFSKVTFHGSRLASINAACRPSPRQQKYSWKRKIMENGAAEKTSRDSERLHLLSALLLLSADPEQSSLSSPAPPTGYLSVKISANPTAIRSTGRFFVLTIETLYNQCFYCKVCKTDPGTVPVESVWTAIGLDLFQP